MKNFKYGHEYPYERIREIFEFIKVKPSLLKRLEDRNPIPNWNITGGGERRVFRIPVSNIPDFDIHEYIQGVANRLRNDDFRNELPIIDHVDLINPNHREYTQQQQDHFDRLMEQSRLVFRERYHSPVVPDPCQFLQFETNGNEQRWVTLEDFRHPIKRIKRNPKLNLVVSKLNSIFVSLIKTIFK
jgi:hypothetical protein